MAITYRVKRLPQRTERGNKWELVARHSDGRETLIGFKQTRKAAVTVASLLAGRAGKVEIVK